MFACLWRNRYESLGVREFRSQKMPDPHYPGGNLCVPPEKRVPPVRTERISPVAAVRLAPCAWFVVAVFVLSYCVHLFTEVKATIARMLCWQQSLARWACVGLSVTSGGAAGPAPSGSQNHPLESGRSHRECCKGPKFSCVAEPAPLSRCPPCGRCHRKS